ncbi:MAG: hypothetical protein HOH58_11270, partial [Opitutaceae bacterium]|nr:hypothetical protein [Opitutaceae bacterium]
FVHPGRFNHVVASLRFGRGAVHGWSNGTRRLFTIERAIDRDWFGREGGGADFCYFEIVGQHFL